MNTHSYTRVHLHKAYTIAYRVHADALRCMALRAPGLLLVRVRKEQAEGWIMAQTNPRWKNGAARRKIRERWRAIGAPCALCGKPIDYSLGMVTDPRTGRRRPHPMSFVVDEIVPIRFGGSPYSMSNTRPAHWICNSKRGDGTHTAPQSLPLPQPWEL